MPFMCSPLSRMANLYRLAPILLLTLVLNACGGGGGGSAGCTIPGAGTTVCGTVTGLPAGQQVTINFDTTDVGKGSTTLSANGPFAYNYLYQLTVLSRWNIYVASESNGTTCTVPSIGNNEGPNGPTTTVAGVVVSCSPAVYYTIGGTVTGLNSGGQFGLSNNGDDSLTITSNGAFTFATPIRGTVDSYMVIMGVQPTGQICSIKNGTGRDVNANVTNVTITCLDAIGGTLTGLNGGDKVTLLDNGSDPLVLNANGTFSFATPLAPGQAYSVSVGTPPTDEHCAVSGGTGVVSAAPTNVQVNCANNEKVLHTFSGGSTDGGVPYGGLLMDTAGNIYGTTTRWGSGDTGTVFKLTPDGSGGYTESVLYSFAHDGSSGLWPYGAPIMDGAGNLYGTTFGGGANNCGVVFKLAPNGTGGYTQSVLYSFKGGTDGKQPTPDLIKDSAGNLYGTTTQGGTNGYGTVFELTPDGSGGYTEAVLYSFYANATDGMSPYSGVIMDGAGNLYGTTQSGGSNGWGTVYRLSPNGSGGYTESILYSFLSTTSVSVDAGNPTGGLIMDSAGNLFGTTEPGYGAVFKLAPNGSGGYTESVLYFFKGGGIVTNDGGNPYSALIMDSAGNLYGTTAGGYYNDTVFKLAPDGKGGYTESILHHFTNEGGGAADPHGPLIMDSAGNLYGTTTGSQIDITDCNSGCGTVFEISP